MQLLWKTIWRFLKKLKIELPYDPAIALLGIYLKDIDVVKMKGHMHPNVQGSDVHNSQTVEGVKIPFKR